MDKRLTNYVTDTSKVLNDALDDGRRVFLKVHKELCWISTKVLILLLLLLIR